MRSFPPTSPISARPAAQAETRHAAYSPTFFHASRTILFASFPKRPASPAICTVIAAMSANTLARDARGKFVDNPKIDRTIENIDKITSDLQRDTGPLLKDAKEAMANANRASAVVGDPEGQARQRDRKAFGQRGDHGGAGQRQSCDVFRTADVRLTRNVRGDGQRSEAGGQLSVQVGQCRGLAQAGVGHDERALAAVFGEQCAERLAAASAPTSARASRVSRSIWCRGQ